MTQSQIASTLAKLGWELECNDEIPLYRAHCHNFITPLRSDPEQVLADVDAIKCKENAEAIGPQKSRW